MPTGYSDFYARHKLWPLGYIVNAYNSTFINNYLKDCFYNYTVSSDVKKLKIFLVLFACNFVM